MPGFSHGGCCRQSLGGSPVHWLIYRMGPLGLLGILHSWDWRWGFLSAWKSSEPKPVIRHGAWEKDLDHAEVHTQNRWGKQWYGKLFWMRSEESGCSHGLISGLWAMSSWILVLALFLSLKSWADWRESTLVLLTARALRSVLFCSDFWKPLIHIRHAQTEPKY